jgi:hypothetical protein
MSTALVPINARSACAKVAAARSAASVQKRAVNMVSPLLGSRFHRFGVALVASQATNTIVTPMTPTPTAVAAIATVRIVRITG